MELSSKIVIYVKAQMNLGPWFAHFSNDSGEIRYNRCPLNAADKNVCL